MPCFPSTIEPLRLEAPPCQGKQEPTLSPIRIPHLHQQLSRPIHLRPAVPVQAEGGAVEYGLRRKLAAAQASPAHGKNDALAERMVREMLNEIPRGKLGREFKPALLDSVHSLAYEKDAKYETLLGKLTPGYLLAWLRGKHSVEPAEKRANWAAAPGGLDLRTYDAEQVSNVQSYGAGFVGLPVWGMDGGPSRLVGKTVFRSASEIDEGLNTLCKEVKSLLERHAHSKDPMEGACVAAHFKQHFIALHPYMDGNGRVSRLVAERILQEFNIPAPNWHGKEYGVDLTVEQAARMMLEPPPSKPK
jgi:hypothetical protein